MGILLVGAGRWLIGARPKRRPKTFRIWSIRFASTAFFIWLFVFGPGTLLAPRLFGFSTASTNGITIYYESGVGETFVQDVLQGAEQARAKNLAFWGQPAGGIQPIDIYLCSSRLRWQQLALWPGANAATYGSNIFIAPLAVPEAHVVAQVVTHEMSHVFVNQRLGNLGALVVPAWMNEGIATYVAQNFWATDESLCQHLEEFRFPELVPAAQLRTHTAWRAAITGSAAQAALAYGHSQSLCASLVREFGADRVIQYVDNTSLFANPDSAFQAAFGVTIGEADRNWIMEAKSAGQIPLSTVWNDLHIGFCVVALSLLPYLLLAFGTLWLIRQVCLIARFVSPLINCERHARSF